MSLSIKNLLILLSSILTIVIFIAGVHISYNKYIDYNKLKHVKLDIENITKSSALLHELQKERGISSLYLSTGDKLYFEKLKIQRDNTDNSRKINNQYLDVDLLDGIRSSVDNQDIWSSLSASLYTSKFNNVMLRKILLSNTNSSDSQINKFKQKYSYFIANKEYMGAIRASLASAFSLNEFTEENRMFFIEVISKYKESSSRFNSIDILNTQCQFGTEIDEKLKLKVEQLIDLAISNKLDFNIDSNEWYKLATSYINKLQVSEELQSNIIIELIDSKLNEIFNTFLFILITISSIIIFMVLITLKIISKILEISNELEYANKRSKAIFNAQNTIIVTTDTKTITDVNKSFFRDFNFKDLEDFKSQYNCICDLFVEKENIPHLLPIVDGINWIEYVKSNPNIIHVAYMVDRQNNERIYEVQISNKIFDEEVVVVFNDITLLKQQANTIQEQSKFVAMGEMIGMIAHQWRQPLTTINAIIGKLNLKRDFNQLDDETWNDSMLKHHNLVRYMDDTINDFLNFYKTANNEQSINSRELIYAPYRIIESTYQKYSIDFKVYDTIEQELIISVNKLEQVLVNLYKNSADEIIEKDMQHGMVEVKCYEYSDTNFVVEVSDNAGGIPEDILSKIFNPYFSTKSKNGTGLGLYMSKVIIEDQLNGKIEVYNKNEGVVFKIILPFLKKRKS